MCNEEKEKELQFESRKVAAQAKMAWTSIVSIIVGTLLLFSPWISIERLTALSEPVTWFYIAMASIVGAFMGLSGWMGKK